MVVAVALGLGLGIWMKDFFGYDWLLWLGIFWGVAAAVLNVYKAYKRQLKSYDELQDNHRYKHSFDGDNEKHS